MTARYIPGSDAQLILWLENFQKIARATAGALGFTAAEAREVAEASAALAAAISTDEQKYAEWRAANARTAELKEATLPRLRRYIERASTSSGWSEEHARAFMAVAARPRPARLDGSFKPSFRVHLLGGKVRIAWRKGDLDAVRIERRISGETGWTDLGLDTRPPFDDRTPLRQPGVPEAREYRLLGFAHDTPVGSPSNVVRVIVGE